ncbi:hypothetical protein [Curtobacterium sp. MCBD17_040]|uniref:hypothetical protein n=1 Tax=Curtobacterium sp. MCBD17_040 TaxID=2175674 RepID=UPI000DAA8A05|nr:hypothetical protein [Curtobacterium sp. MCBD17_040]WIB65396.1 hypothetical protein DEI94_18490 [Curtobacterium sp. MCBD17_040]
MPGTISDGRRSDTPSAAAAVHRSLRNRFHAWVAAWIVADDPHPEYSRLDRMDGLRDYQLPQPATHRSAASAS